MARFVVCASAHEAQTAKTVGFVITVSVKIDDDGIACEVEGFGICSERREWRPIVAHKPGSEKIFREHDDIGALLQG